VFLDLTIAPRAIWQTPQPFHRPWDAVQMKGNWHKKGSACVKITAYERDQWRGDDPRLGPYQSALASTI
jgi:hypothetical protein